MLTLGGARNVAMQLLCDRLYTVRYHWRGRSLLCCGREDCVGCQIDRPRPVSYAVATLRFGIAAEPDRSNVVRGVVELCASARLLIERAQRTYGKLAGCVVEMRRRSSRQEWSSVCASWSEPKNSIGDDSEVMAALAVVLRVDDPREGESFDAWLAGASAMHRGLMRGTQLIV